MADTLKDFLVGIGFKVDQIAQRQAEEAVRRTEERNTARAEKESEKRRKIEAKEAQDRDKERKDLEKKEQERRAKSLKEAQGYVLKMSAFAVKAVAAVEASALGVVYAVDKAAKSFERLNYMSQRTGSTPGRIGAFGYASSQLGSSADEANSSLEAFGQKLRVNGSGYAQALERLGVKARDANGHLRDSAEIATDLGDALRRVQQNGGQYGYSNAITQASTFGFSETQTRALMNPDFRKREGEFASDQKKIGADPNAAAKSGTDFEQSMGHLNEVLGQIETKLAGVLFKKLKPLLDDLSDWFKEHGDKVADIIGRIADDLVKLAKAIADKLAGANWSAILDNVEQMAKWFDVLAKKLTGDGGLTTLFTLFGAALAIKVLSPLVKILSALRVLGGLALPSWLAGRLGIPLAVAGAAGVAAVQALPDDQKDQILDRHQALQDVRKHRFGGTWNKIKQAFGADAPTGNDALWARGRKGQHALKSAAGAWNGKDAKGGWWTPERQKHAYDRLIDKGVPPNAAIALISRWKNVESTGRGPNAINPTSGAAGIGQWLGSRKNGMGSSFDEQLDHAADEVTSGSGGALAKRIFMNGGDDRQMATGASAYERAEGYDPKSGVDNFTGATEQGIPEVRRNVQPQTPPLGTAPPLKTAPPLPSAGVPQGLTGGGYTALGLDASGRPVRLGDTPALHQSLSSTTKGDTVVTHNPTFNISGGDGPSNLEAARRMASRGHQDLLRNIQGMEQ